MEKRNRTAMELYYDSLGCGCCIELDDPNWDDIEKQLREEIAQEIEQYKPLFSWRKKMELDPTFAFQHTKEVAARIARGTDANL